MPGTVRPTAPPISIQSSDELLEAYCRSGLPADFEQIVRRFAALVLSECRRVTGNSHDAEDASQLVFLALAMELKAGSTIKRLGPWLQRVAKHQGIKIVRSRGRRRRREDAVRRPERHNGDANGAIDQAAVAGRIRDAIDNLPERYRLPLVLHYFGGLSLELIARELKISRQAVGTRLHRGRKMLGERLQRHGITLDAVSIAAAMAILVPAGVIAGVIRTAATIAPTCSAAALPGAMAGLLHAVSGAALRRPLMSSLAAAVVVGLGATSLGWVPVPSWSSLPRIQLDVKALLDRLFGNRPRYGHDGGVRPPAAEPGATERLIAHASLPPRFDPSLAAAPQPWSIAADVLRYEATTAAAPAVRSQVTSQPPFGDEDRRVQRQAAGPSTVAVSAPRVGTMSLTPMPAAERPLAAAGGRPLKPTTDAPALGNSPERVPAAFSRGHHRFAGLDIGVGSTVRTEIGPGVVVEADTLRLGVSNHSEGHVLQTGGLVKARQVVIGDAGKAVYDHRGGRLDVGNLTIAAQPRSQGEMRVSGDRAELRLTEPKGTVTVGQRGAGRLVLGTPDAPGRVTAAENVDARVIVRASVGARGIVQGWGDFFVTGALVNNGRVVADGYDSFRALNLTRFTTIGNTIDNPRDGYNGWYVQRGGALELPAITVRGGTNTYTWGESAEDATIDLVNSLRFTVYNQPDDADEASVSIRLRTAVGGDDTELELPDTLSVLSLYEVDSRNVAPSAVDLTVRYNPTLPTRLRGEDAIQLFSFDSAVGWQIVDAMWTDTANRWVGGTVAMSSIRYLAVGVPWYTVEAFSISDDHAAFVNPRPGGVPEPGAIGLISLGLATTSRRRRRRRG